MPPDNSNTQDQLNRLESKLDMINERHMIYMERLVALEQWRTNHMVQERLEDDRYRDVDIRLTSLEKVKIQLLSFVSVMSMVGGAVSYFITQIILKKFGD
jgi:hypothetical protein